MDATDTIDRWPLVIIGGGLAGLSAAAAWQRVRPDEPVLVLDKEPQTGGYVTTYRRKRWRFDTAQMMPDLSAELAFLGVDVPLVRFDGPALRVVLVDPVSGDRQTVEVPCGHEPFRAMLQRRFPDQARAVGRWLDHSRGMYEELGRLAVEPGVLDIADMLLTCPTIVRNAGRTFEQYLARFDIDEPLIHEIINVFVEFAALPRGQVAALVPVSAMHSLLDGAYRPAGEFVELPRALQRRVEDAGGTVGTRAEVDRILTESGRVQAVRLTSGEVIPARRVITTVDPRVAMTSLVGLDVLHPLDPRYVAQVEAMRMSWSSFNINLGLDDDLDFAALDLDGGYNVLTTGVDSFEELFSACERGEIGYGPDRFHLGVVAPTLVTGGAPYLTIRVLPMALGRWGELRAADKTRYRAEKQRWADLFIDLVQRHLVPDLRRHVGFVDISTPATYARYSGSPTGSVYDMAPTPDNFGRTRLAMRTPVRGLIQPKFVHGILGAIVGGMQAVDLLTDGAVMGGRSMMPRRSPV